MDRVLTENNTFSFLARVVQRQKTYIFFIFNFRLSCFSS